MSIRIEDLPHLDFSDLIQPRARRIPPTSPGEMLVEEFLKPLEMSNYRLAKEIGVPAQRIGEIIAGRRSITADTDLRLCRFFGLSDGWWLRLQADYDTRIARDAMSKALAKIKPWPASTGRGAPA
ncbi:MAG: higA [Hydrocarboniphaga sp.]|uniref:HigA family addiction module antitoxin n=1 Tax=Hydrocarboniphaga sp. TaxID=2033016 RepID=UPI002632CAE2|nr:HigA family addiction module antitoxin [Hydrocarboniphaga sp.]MDB5968019.1 higA [Hydrocarboniphaga sp.]